ncbi:MAG: universal stress protein [Flavobacteriales bacterium]|nr:universal stress protein [Flavobacteriales bacterium]
MKLVERICFPTDFGKSSKAALEIVISIAKKFGSEVSLVHVLPDWKNRKKIQRFVDQEMSRYVALLEEQGIKCTSNILNDDYIDKVVSFAEKKRSNLIVIEAGRPGKGKFKLGSNSEKIIRNSSVPVWVIKKDSAVNPDQVLCPIDFSEESMLSLDNAIHLCRRFRSKLYILHVIKGIAKEYAELGADTSIEQAEIVAAKELEFDELIKERDLSGIVWSKVVKLGSPGDVILSVIKEKNIDLVVMGSTGKGALKRFFLGSIAQKVSREVPCSFIISKTEGLIHVKLDREITDIESIYMEGVELANSGFLQEAIIEWTRCIHMNELYLKAWSAIAKAHESLGDTESAASFIASRNRIQQGIWDKQVEADLRGKHFLFK